MFLRRVLGSVLLTWLATCSLSLAAAERAATSGGKLKSSVFDWTDLAPQPTAEGERREMVDLPTATFERLESEVVTLSSGKRSLPPQRHPDEAIVILKDGTLEVMLNGQTQRVGAGSVIFFAANDLYQLHNVGESSASYFLFNITTAARDHALEADNATPSATSRLGSKLFDWEKLVVEATDTGKRRGVMNAPTATFANLDLHIITLNPGQVPNSRWTHPDEELLVVKEGELEVTIGTDSRRIRAGSVCFFAANEPHGWMNVGQGDATYYVIRVVTGPTSAGK